MEHPTDSGDGVTEMDHPEMSTEKTFRYRLTGAILLIVLAVIFLPWLFDGAGYEHMTGIDEPVPPRPSFAEPDIKLPGAGSVPSTRPVAPVDAGRTEGALVSDATSGTDSGAARPAPLPEDRSADTRPVQAGWVVQVGSFRDEKNAREQRDHLRKAGLPAFIDPADTDTAERTIYRVKVGPRAQRDEALELGQRLEEEFELSGIVVTFP